VRALILAAGLGTRMRPLSDLLAKPAMPVRGVPVIAHTLHLLARHDVNEVVINLHHLPETIRAAVERHRPARMTVRYSEEAVPLGTGGGLRRAADFLGGSDPSLVLAGDMLLDVDLTQAIARHRARGDRFTVLLRRDDPRAAAFGTIGLDETGCVRRIGRRFDLGGENAAGLFTGVRIAAARSLAGWPDQPAFEDLSDWLGPQLRRGASDIRADVVAHADLLWEPVGTPEEYLQVNLHPPELSYEDSLGERAVEVRAGEVVVSEGAEIEVGAELERAVVWAGEHVPATTRGHDGVFAGGRFHACAAPLAAGQAR
jgi:mannose-1-phosphate guanylyltransferase